MDDIPGPGFSPTYSPALPPAQPQRRRLPRFFWVLVGLVLVLALSGAAFIAYYFFLLSTAPNPTTWADPWDALNPAEISMGLAAWSLTDVEPEQLYRQALAVDAVESAAAEALANTRVQETQRLGWLTVLVRRQAALGQRVKAGRLNIAAADLAMLMPQLGDRQRAEALAGLAEDWIRLGEEAMARRLLEQVILIARHSAELSPPARNQILERAAASYAQIGDLDAARTTRALPPGAPAPPASAPDPLFILESPPAYNQQVIAFRSARVDRAQAFVNTWIERGGQAARGELQALEAALIDEDLARTAFYSAFPRGDAVPAEAEAQVLWDEIRWLLIKHRAANGLYGGVVVGGWTAELPAIRQVLQDRFVEFREATLRHIQTLPPAQQPAATYRLYRTLLMWARIGLYPGADQVFLANALNDALARWEGASGILPVASIAAGGEVSIQLAVVSNP